MKKMFFLGLLLSNAVFAGPFGFGPKFDLPIIDVPPDILAPAGKPDLVVSEFFVTGPVRSESDGGYTIPVRVVVKNQGEAVAGKFLLSAGYVTSKGDFMLAFEVEGQRSLWKPMTMASLYPGETVAIEGVLHAHAWFSGEAVDLYVVADSCAGDEFMPDYCRVKESDEGNNKSGFQTVTLP